jgi:hypothetical protein
MSGELGKSITKGISALGGAALGGMALGGAFLGRNIIGRGMAWASKTDNAKFHGEQKLAFDKKIENWEKGGRVGNKPKWKDHIQDATVEIAGKRYFENKKGEIIEHKQDIRTKIGGFLNYKQKDVGNVDHARHEIDSAVEKSGFKGKEYGELSGVQQQKVQDTFVKENKSKWSQEEEDNFRRSKGYTDKQALSPTEVSQLKERINKRAFHEFEHEMELASKKIAGVSRGISKINTGSWDIRNLSQINADRREGVLTKLPTFLTSSSATLIRSGILKQAGLSGGGVKVEGKFFDDLKSVLKDSFKGIKIELPESHGGGHGGGGHGTVHDDHGGGGHGGGHH